MIPCKQCLKFPVCLGRKEIRCDDFHDYLVKVYREKKEIWKEFLKMNHLDIEHQNQAWDSAWDVMQETFPYMRSLYRGVGRYTRYGGKDEPTMHTN